MTDIYHVIGFPVKHSLSPKIQMTLAQQYNQDMIFTAIEIAPEHLAYKIAEFKSNSAIKGLSVTVPHKETVFDLCDGADDTAKDVRAASNVIFTDDRKMIALNYDGLGIINDIKKNHHIEIQDKSVLVIGAGGAAKSVIASIIKENPKSITVANRTYSKAILVKELFTNKFNIELELYTNITKAYDIIINSTSSSIHNELLPLSPFNFNKNAFAYDLMYKQDGTIFTKWCKDIGVVAEDGKGMLQELSTAVFKYWRGL